MVCLDHVIESLFSPTGTAKVGIKKLKEQDKCEQVGATVAATRNNLTAKNTVLGDSGSTSSTNECIRSNINAK
jgi:hypothetical protein